MGRVAFGVPGAYSSGIRKITSTDSVYDNFGFKYLLFKAKSIQDTIQEHATGTVILHAGTSINFLSIPLPVRSIIQKFNRITEPLFEKIFSNQTQIRTLEKLRDTLLPKLMRGEVRLIR